MDPSALLRDIAEQTLTEPQCPRSWHRLMQLWQETHDQATRQQVVQQVEASPLDDARAEILRLTFLSDLTGERRFTDQAAALVLAIEPFNPDRLATFMAEVWLDTLKKQAGRATFVHALRKAHLPELATRLARCASAQLPANVTARLPRGIKRIAIITPYLGNGLHTPSVMTANQCDVLAKEGRRVHVFSCQELKPPEMTQYRGSTISVLLPPLDLNYWRSVLPSGANLTFSESRLSLAQRWRNMFPKIMEFDPDAILLVGLYSPAAAALYSVRPVVGLNVHTLPPLAPLDVWLSADEGSAQHPPEGWEEAFAAPLLYSHPYRIKRPQGPWSVTRPALGLADDAVVWVSIGGRLESEVSGPWATRMLELLVRTPHAVWLLVGGAGNLPKALEQAPPGKVIHLATRPDIGGILHLSDIYLNPPRMGGGFSVAEAMAVGLPVLSFVDSDGGDKVGELALTDTDAYVERLSALTANPDLRSEMGQLLSSRFSQRFDLAASAPSLIAALELAVDAARERLGSQQKRGLPLMSPAVTERHG